MADEPTPEEEASEEVEESTDEPEASDDESAASDEEEERSEDESIDEEATEPPEEEADEEKELQDLQAAMSEEGTEETIEETEEEPEPVRPVLKHEGQFYGTGRRKESIARVWIEAGTGSIRVNDREGEAYFQHRPVWVKAIQAPMECLGFEDEVDVWATIEGGGLTGQAEALQLGIARALVDMDEHARHWLKQENLLTRDDRQVERKKINQPGARAKRQVSKR